MPTTPWAGARWTPARPVDSRNRRSPVRSTVACMSAALPSENPGSPEPPVVPGYTLEVLLGRGGSGEVWRAVPRRGGVPVAVKVLVAGDPERQAREAALLGELDHPHLVRLVEVVHQPRRGGRPGSPWSSSCWPGGVWRPSWSDVGGCAPGEVVTTIAPVAAALAHAHENGVVHGDLSPGNIVFTAEGRPVLTDLGVARVLGETAAEEVTPAYVDPVVARGGAPGPASDVFGVAAAAFHALTGIAPGTQPHPGTPSMSPPPACCPTWSSWRRRPRPSCSRSSPAAWHPIRTIGGRQPRSRWTSGTPAARSRCGCRWRAYRTWSWAAPVAVRARSSPTRCRAVGPARRRRSSPGGTREVRWAAVQEWLRAGRDRRPVGPRGQHSSSAVWPVRSGWGCGGRTPGGRPPRPA